MHHPHIMYADLETILYGIQSCKPNTNNSYTEKINTHIASGYALHLVRTYDDNLISSNRGTDCIQRFVKPLKMMAKIVIDTPQKIYDTFN